MEKRYLCGYGLMTYIEDAHWVDASAYDEFLRCINSGIGYRRYWRRRYLDYIVIDITKDEDDWIHDSYTSKDSNAYVDFLDAIRSTIQTIQDEMLGEFIDKLN